MIIAINKLSSERKAEMIRSAIDLWTVLILLQLIHGLTEI